MDPLSISGTCAGLISLIITTTTATSAFIRTCRGARGDLTTVIGDLGQLSAILGLLKNDDTSVVPEPMQVEILSLLQKCTATVGDIETVLKALGNTKGFPVKWAASGKQKVESLRAKLQGYLESLGLTIDIIGLHISQAIKADTGTLLDDMEEVKARLSTILENLASPQVHIQDGTLGRDIEGGSYVLGRYLDTLTNYAETVCGDLPPTEPSIWGGVSGQVGIDLEQEEPGIATISFENTVGRQFRLPLEHCKKWEAMRGFILDSYLNSENKPWLRGGRYDLLGPRNEIIMPSYWGQVIQAGWVVKMVEHPRQEIHFKDAVGRKYTFPLELCQELAAMRTLIEQCFEHVEVIGPQVKAGCYDLLGPNDVIILPELWDTIVQPGWRITMVMWPLGERKAVSRKGKSTQRGESAKSTPSDNDEHRKSAAAFGMFGVPRKKR